MLLFGKLEVCREPCRASRRPWRKRPACECSPSVSLVAARTRPRNADAARGAADGATGVVEQEAGQRGGFAGIACDAVGDEGGGQVRVPRIVRFDDVLAGIGAELEQDFGVAGAGGGDGKDAFHRVPIISGRGIDQGRRGSRPCQTTAALNDGESGWHVLIAVAGVVDPGAQGLGQEAAGLGFLVVAGADVDLLRQGRVRAGAEIDVVRDAGAGHAHAIVAAAGVAAHGPQGAGFAVGVGEESQAHHAMHGAIDVVGEGGGVGGHEGRERQG